MNRLPKVLQNEIWEYVHGNRAFFKQQFQIVMTELSFLPPKTHLNSARMLRSQDTFKVGANFVQVGFDQKFLWKVSLTRWFGRRYRLGPWQVQTFDFLERDTNAKRYFRFEEARAEFHRQVVIAATKTTQQQQRLLAGRGRQ